MMPLEVTEIAAIVSLQICDICPSFTRVNRLLPDNRTIEMTWVENDDDHFGFDMDRFWPTDCTLSPHEKLALYWKYTRSTGCNHFSAILAKVLKGLCDNGELLVHNGMPVVDIFALNSMEFDVSDILSSSDQLLKIHDPVSDVTVPCISTHQQMEKLLNMGEKACHRLGLELPEKVSKEWNMMKKYVPDSYKTTVPHWWLAVVVEGQDTSHSEKQHTMVHLDVCGAAYDESALSKVPGNDSLVSLKVFSTPEYELRPHMAPGLSHKLVMLPTLRPSTDRQRGRMSHQPKSLRYFRCYHAKRPSPEISPAAIEVTPLQTFLKRNEFDDAKNVIIDELVETLQQPLSLKNLRVGTKVLVCNIQSKPELNGQSGIIRKATVKDHENSDRIPVLVHGMAKPISLKLSCIRLPPQKQYNTPEELMKLNSIETPEDVPEPSQLSKRERQQLKNKLNSNDPAIAKVLQAIQSGDAGFTRMTDPEYKRGVKEFTQPPLNAMLPAEYKKMFKNCYELSNHPKAMDAIKIINMRKAAKQRLMTIHPECLQPNGAIAVPLDSECMRLQENIENKIRGDEGLAFVFKRLDELGLYVNPIK